jgi:hypothetical protein
MFAPIPVVAQPKPDWQANSECAINTGLFKDDAGLVIRNIHLIGVRRFDFDVAVIAGDRFLLRAWKVAEALGLGAEALNGVHDIGLLRGKGLPQLRRPRKVIVQPFEDSGVMGQGLDARVPRLLIGLIGIAAFGDITVRHDDLAWERGGGKDFGNQRIGIKCDWAGHLV